MLMLLLGVAAMAPPVVAPPPPVPPVPGITRLSSHDPANVMRLFSTDDYPADAIRNEEQGTVSYRATVGTDGRVSRCEIVVTSGSISLDTATCQIIQRRARFSPARDQQGAPVDDHFDGRIRWVLPEPDPTPFADQRNLAIFTSNGGGTIATCRVIAPQPGPTDDQLCPVLRRAAQQLVTMNPSLQLTEREIVLEQGLLIGGPDTANFIGQGPGEKLIGRAAFALTIDAEGKVVDCVAVAGSVGSEVHTDGCTLDRSLGFTPLESVVAERTNRHAVRYFASYTRPSSR